MDTYCTEIRKLESKFYDIEYHHIVRDANQEANRLSKQGSSRAKVLAGVFVQDLMTPSIKEGRPVDEAPPAEQLVLVVPPPSPDWREQFIKYLTTAEVPSNRTEME